MSDSPYLPRSNQLSIVGSSRDRTTVSVSGPKVSDFFKLLVLSLHLSEMEGEKNQ